MTRPSSPLSDTPVLVVGTTPDYVEWIRRARPGRALFLTDHLLRQNARESAPSAEEEITAVLDDTVDSLESAVREHLKTHARALSGIACFDCERMVTASELALRLGLRYPSAEAVFRCRDKSRSKAAWSEQGVPCPRFCVPDSSEELVSLTREWKVPFVLKPLTGSGSELTFRCESPSEGEATFRRMSELLEAKRDVPMYRDSMNGCAGVLVEEWVSGPEFSCDFLVEDGTARLVRMCRKHLRGDAPFGTTDAYELIHVDQSPFDPAVLRYELVHAAEALGIDRAWCMADFIERAGAPAFLEITPRPGGDCIPWLLRAAHEIDVLGQYLDFVEGTFAAPDCAAGGAVGLRLFAHGEGTLRHVETGRLTDDPRVREVTLRRRAGDKILLPPRDYDSWILGHAVYIPEPGRPIERQNEELAGRIEVEWE